MVDRVVGTMVRQLKKVSKGKACNQVGRWHRDAQCPICPKNQNKTKEAHHMENVEAETGKAILCGALPVGNQDVEPSG